MRSIVNLCFCALAASNAVKAYDNDTPKNNGSNILTDIDVISRYWGV